MGRNKLGVNIISVHPVYLQKHTKYPLKTHKMLKPKNVKTQLKKQKKQKKSKKIANCPKGAAYFSWEKNKKGKWGGT